MNQTSNRAHATESSLERYAMSALSDDETEVFEEHLLFCGECQVRLSEMDSFVQSTRAAAHRLEQEPPSFFERLRQSVFALPRPALAAGLAAALAVVVIVPSQLQNFQTPQNIELSAFRGEEAAPVLKAGIPATVSLDVTALAAASAYAVEVVDARGSEVWGSRVQTNGNKIVASVPKLTTGRYWVRVYGDTLKADLLREFALTVQ
ncbi:MAG: hypothetical protein H7039_02330 [Bryobacteraceae bacterium]|nr:hypothetical protein [Bryobacteraceae bacterium]